MSKHYKVVADRIGAWTEGQVISEEEAGEQLDFFLETGALKLTRGTGEESAKSKQPKVKAPKSDAKPKTDNK